MTCLCKQHSLILFVQQSHIFVIQQSPANVIALFHDGGDMEAVICCLAGSMLAPFHTMIAFHVVSFCNLIGTSEICVTIVTQKCHQAQFRFSHGAWERGWLTVRVQCWQQGARQGQGGGLPELIFSSSWLLAG